MPLIRSQHMQDPMTTPTQLTVNASSEEVMHVSKTTAGRTMNKGNNITEERCYSGEEEDFFLKQRKCETKE